MRLMTNDELEAVSGGLMSVKSRGDFKGTKPSKPAGSKEQSLGSKVADESILEVAKKAAGDAYDYDAFSDRTEMA